MEVHLRLATPADVDGIAELHADSWRRNYRGAFPDAFLDGDLVAERRGVWTERLTAPGPLDHTLVAEAEAEVEAEVEDGHGHGHGSIVGLAHTIFDRHPEWGAVIDNLHVRHGLKGQGIGRRLVTATAAVVAAHDPASGMYVEVLDQNTPAQAFYERLGAHHVHTGPCTTPGGGRTSDRIYAWPAPLRIRPGPGSPHGVQKVGD
jgi:ribosomal protein S18 acetylase RimI-like enzyme